MDQGFSNKLHSEARRLSGFKKRPWRFSMKTALLGFFSATILTSTVWSAPMNCQGYNPSTPGHGAALYQSVVLNTSSQGNSLDVTTIGNDQATYQIVAVVPKGKVTKYELAAESGPILGMDGQTLRSDTRTGAPGEFKTYFVVARNGLSLKGFMSYEKLNRSGKVTRQSEPMESCVQAVHFN
jgi:hypothetical protein